MRRRVVSLWFPRLPADRLLRQDHTGGTRPFAVVAEEMNALRLYALNRAAEAAGLIEGMALSDARAIFPDLQTVVAAPDHDASFLGALHRWAGRYSPFIARDGRDALILDITGCAHLFGGEEPMLADMLQRLEDLRLEAHAGCADTKGAAWALARERRGAVIAPPGETRAAIADLPLGALRIDRDTVAGLNRLGLGKIGDLTSVPRASLARRFGVELVKRLDQATGMTYEPAAPSSPPKIFAARMTLPEPIGLLDDVREALRRVLAQVCKRLEDAACGARGFRLAVRRSDHSEEMIEIGLAQPARDEALAMRLFERKLEKLDAGFGIEFLRAQAVKVAPLSARQLSGEPSEQSADAVDELIARVGNRIGFDHVKRFRLADSHIPEREFAYASATAGKLSTAGNPAGVWGRPPRPRPLTLFAPERAHMILPGRPPKAIAWRGRKIDIARAEGPERIAPEWWRMNSGWGGKPKDYWRVTAADGERLWLCCDYACDDADARWHVCGEFA
ncbi:MAG: DNA polymerase Y family protein [Marinicaulis sp.]|nr:DNA polymerase Y family protein [Marinicaulis sp.]